jgi:hypothetical protein
MSSGQRAAGGHAPTPTTDVLPTCGTSSTCGHFEGGEHCGALAERRYLMGHRCPTHEPVQPQPDPSMTARALRDRVLPMPDQSRYGRATTDPLGREGPGWTKGRNGLPVQTKGDKNA